VPAVGVAETDSPSVAWPPAGGADGGAVVRPGDEATFPVTEPGPLLDHFRSWIDQQRRPDEARAALIGAAATLAQRFPVRSLSVRCLLGPRGPPWESAW
jgi:hypothetical protein